MNAKRRACPVQGCCGVRPMHILETMENELLQAPQEIAVSLWQQAQVFVEGLMRPWNAYQVAIAIGLFVAAHLLSRLLAPYVHAWMRGREGWPNWRMRFLVMLHRRLRLIFFVVLILRAVWIMQSVTWPR